MGKIADSLTAMAFLRQNRRTRQAIERQDRLRGEGNHEARIRALEAELRALRRKSGP